MTLRDAIKILLEGAGRDARGVGCGIRSGLTPEQHERMAEAARVCWRHAYKWDASNNDLRNLGFRPR